MAVSLESHDLPTIGFICPLYAEIKAVRAIFDQELSAQEVEGTEYIYGTIGSRTAVAVQFLYGEIGPTSATEHAAKLLQLHPTLKLAGSYCFLVGIAGGIWSGRSDVRLGDVVIATKIHDWRSGQLTQDGFVQTKYPEHASDVLRRKLGSFLYNRCRLGPMITTLLSRMKEDHGDSGWLYPGELQDRLYNSEYRHQGSRGCHSCDPSQLQTRHRRPNPHPWIHDGLLASGPVVLKDAATRATLQEAGVLAVDMEACGIPKNFVVIRAISDYADGHKDDEWHPYAAATAAASARLMIDNFIEKPRIPNTSPRSPTEPTSHLGDVVQHHVGQGADSSPTSVVCVPPQPSNATRSSQGSPQSAVSYRQQTRNQKETLSVGQHNLAEPLNDTFNHLHRYHPLKIELTLTVQNKVLPKRKDYTFTNTQLILEIRTGGGIYDILRRVRLIDRHSEQLDTHVLWLPLTGVNIGYAASKSAQNPRQDMVRFSFESNKSDDPNNKIQQTLYIWFGTPYEAWDLWNRLTYHTDPPAWFKTGPSHHSSTRLLTVDLHSCRFFDGACLHPAFLISKRGSTIATFDLVGFGSSLDFEVSERLRVNPGVGTSRRLFMRGLKHIVNELPMVDDIELWLQLHSKSGPIKARFGDNDLDDPVVFMTEPALLRDILDCIVGPALRLSALGYFDVTALFGGYEFPRCNLSVWTENPEGCSPPMPSKSIKLYFRTDRKATYRNRRLNNAPLWISANLPFAIPQGSSDQELGTNATRLPLTFLAMGDKINLTSAIPGALVANSEALVTSSTQSLTIFFKSKAEKHTFDTLDIKAAMRPSSYPLPGTT